MNGPWDSLRGVEGSAQFGSLNLAQLKKQLGSLEVFAVAAGAMISSGLFVLPAIAYAKAGPAVILSYLFAFIANIFQVF